MKITFLYHLSIFAFFIINSNTVCATNYKLNDTKIDQLFSSSTELIVNESNETNIGDSFGFLFGGNLKPAEDNKQMVAGAIAIASVVLGVGVIFPFHRFIIGTGGQSFKIFALYCITLGGCGVITLVDGVLLLMDGNGTKYLDNSKFIMWN
jgi:TM2 domain-containing membrane protein YozV